MKYALLLTVLMCSCTQDGDWAKRVANQVKSDLPEATLLRTTHHDFTIGHMIFATWPVDVRLFQDDDESDAEGANGHEVVLVTAMVYYRDDTEPTRSSLVPYSWSLYYFSVSNADLYWKVPLISDWMPTPESKSALSEVKIHTDNGLSDRIVPGAMLQYSQPIEIGSIAADNKVTAQWGGGQSIASELRAWAVQNRLPNNMSVEEANSRLNELASE